MSPRTASLAFRQKQRLTPLARGWYRFSWNPLHVVGLLIVILIAIVAGLAPQIAPYPEHAGPYTNFRKAGLPPSREYLLGTDRVGRDVLTRIIFGYRFSLLLGVVVLCLSVPFGVLLGLIAGYFHGSWVEIVIMRVTDVFLAVPPLALAMAVAAMLTPNLFNAMLAISLCWWPWYTRLIYGLTLQLRGQPFVRELELTGAHIMHILIREILPNCLGPLLTKVTLDMGFAILMGASLSFVGLGAQPPTPDLGTMVADGAKRLPREWWSTIFPALAIVLVILGFNLVGDGLRDVFAEERV